jgi:hypothetical protein
MREEEKGCVYFRIPGLKRTFEQRFHGFTKTVTNAMMSADAKRPAAAPFPSATLDCLRSLLSGSCSS